MVEEILSVEKRLLLLRYNLDKQPHITVDHNKCRMCEDKPCIRACPAGLYKAVDMEIEFNYEGCLECGTCRIVCPLNAVNWSYPRGGFGVVFNYG